MYAQTTDSITLTALGAVTESAADLASQIMKKRHPSIAEDEAAARHLSGSAAGGQPPARTVPQQVLNPRPLLAARVFAQHATLRWREVR